MLKIKLGKNPETNLDVYISLKPLIRQSLLITGAQGTGKTTALLTIIARAATANPPIHFLILDWSGEYISLEKVEELKGKVHVISWWKLVYGSLYEKPEVIAPLLIEDPRVTSAVAGLIKSGLAWCTKMKLYPSKEILKMGIENSKGSRKPETVDIAIRIIDDLDLGLIREEPSDDKIIRIKDFIEYINKYNVVIVDFSKTEDEHVPDYFEFKKSIAEYLAEAIWNEARLNKRFGCVIVSDEAHRLCPEFEPISPIWHRLATEGGRNCCPLWLVARRLSIVSKKVTTEAQQNFICFNVEDIDRRRVEEDLGTTFAGLLGSLAAGEAMVKSNGFRIPGQVIHVKFDKIIEPASAIHGPEDRFKAMAEIQ
ncbi:MAG TPA: DUF87 domain-containing protein [Desulfobacterales bacterium]|nr:DUF87 domain-containing protein [Desulfobacterales bacterium]